MKRSSLSRGGPLQRRTGLQISSSLVTRKPLRASSSLVRSHALKPSAAASLLARRGALVSRPKPAVSDIQHARWSRMKEIGCVACLLNHGLGWRRAPITIHHPLEIHHLLSGGRRRGHDDAVCLCCFHHQGTRLPDATQGYRAQAELYGPSLAREGKRFRDCYGDEDQLLVTQRQLLAASGWRDAG